MSREIRNWYEIDSHDNLIVWQGVCAVFHRQSLVCELFKLHSSNVYSIRLADVPFKCISSTAFWECVEITGEFSNDQSFLYHAPNAEEAEHLLKKLEELTRSKITRMTIRLDDDPLRLRNSVWISERLQKWKNVLTIFDSSHIVIDHNMPL
ncbi:unnamed protein product [Auanema sp. JU1783]|nr:unnamed protein product [Auanema sp. JU1783]